MRKELLFVLLNGFADWEAAHLAVCINSGVKPERPVKYISKTLSLTKEPIVSIGGFTVLPDYDIHTLPEDYAGLVLVGGDNWFSPEAESLVLLVEKMIRENKLVGGICNASVFLGKHGFLNHVKHTSNTLGYLKNMAGEKYTGDAHYIEKQAVRDGNIVTANGTAQLEFSREILYALNADEPEIIEESYSFYKKGFLPNGE
ncbi:MAG: glutamine amidotransferase [Tannerella sp.]|jgi:putative intracellular protease/amidase|nr:glutamine amidotransferase [Tannerella sp.]